MQLPSVTLIRHFYKAGIGPVMLSGAECWAPKKCSKRICCRNEHAKRHVSYKKGKNQE